MHSTRLDMLQKPTILDGGMSRELMRINAPFQQPEWSAYALMEDPKSVQQIHAEFAAAGADVLTTNSYALVPFHIGEDRFEQQGKELAQLAGRLAQDAALQEHARSGRTILVAGSLPPIFGSYRPGLFDESRVHHYLDILVQGLNPFVDVWLGETLSLIAEAKAVQVAIGRAPKTKPFWISFTIDDREEKSSATLRSGELVTDATWWALDAGADAILFNCSQPEFMMAAIRDARTVVKEAGKEIQIGVYANAFEQNNASYAANENVSAIRNDLDLKKYTSFARDWVNEGASIVGGCCGVGCAHIKQLALELRDKTA